MHFRHNILNLLYFELWSFLFKVSSVHVASCFQFQFPVSCQCQRVNLFAFQMVLLKDPRDPFVRSSPQ